MLLIEFDRTSDLDKLASNDERSLERYSRDGSDGTLALAETGATTLVGGQVHVVTQLVTGGKYGNAGGAFLFHVAFRPPVDYRQEFLAWFEVEHLPMLLGAKGWDGCRFVEEQVDEGLLFRALHQLSDRSALESEERKRSQTTPWSQRLSQNPWFGTGFVRTLYRRV
jgi:hypothetical protein